MKNKPRNEIKPMADLPRDQRQEGQLERESGEIAKAYEPTPEERAAAKAIVARKSKVPRIKVEEINGKSQLSLAHPNPVYGQALIMKALTTGNVDFYGEILDQLAGASVHHGQVRERELNFMLAVVEGIQPKDQLETLLAAQMAVVHSLAMNMAGRMTDVFTIDQQEVTGRLINNLTRTFAAQLEALKRYRSNGEQKVTVEHVTVNEGGKAIVGNVAHGGEGVSGNRETTS
jgi:hypothetical protein